MNAMYVGIVLRESQLLNYICTLTMQISLLNVPLKDAINPSERKGI
jgi:hypothetical protein